MAYALKTSCAKNIIGVIPYFPYSKQCKMRKRGSIVCKLLASMLTKAGKVGHYVFFSCFIIIPCEWNYRLMLETWVCVCVWGGGTDYDLISNYDS